MTSHQQDPLTGRCADCGATIHEMDDYPGMPCEKAAGPNRLTIIVAARELRETERDLGRLQSEMRRHEELTVQFQRAVRERGAQCEELRASLGKLKAE